MRGCPTRDIIPNGTQPRASAVATRVTIPRAATPVKGIPSHDRGWPIIDRLTEVKRIGRWTAEMFLVFALNRPDVLPVGDLGVRVGLADLPTPAECVALAEPWRPFRTVAMWHVWWGLDVPKQPPVRSQARSSD